MTHARSELTPDAKGMVVINCKVRPETRTQLMKLADEDDRTLQGYCRRVFEAHVLEATYIDLED